MTDTTETVWHPSACILCENNCGIRIQVSGRRLVKIRGDRDHPASAGYTCNKALRLDHYQNGGERLTSPLRREADGRFTPIDWPTAIREIAQRLRAVRDAHGGDAILFYGGGGQGNHLGGTYSSALAHALGSRQRSNALAQEKTGEAWVDAHLVGTHTTGDFEHAEVSVFVGKNPWQSHGLPRARTVLRQIARDPARTMIVIDPVRTETADLADVHLQVRPGTDAWCLAAILAVVVQEDLLDHDFLREHVTDVEPVLEVLRDVDVARFSVTCGVAEPVLRDVARRIARAASVSTYEDLGIQQAPNSTLVSYLNKLIWILTGNFGRRGTVLPHSWLAPLARYDTEVQRTRVTGAAMFGGMMPCNVIPEEILTDHPDRLRAMWIDSANPAHSLADSATFREALAALDLVVVVDVAMTETARLADYVLPAASQFEKWEATFFTLEFPRNTFHLRAPLLDPLPGTLAEPEIYARIIRELDVVPRAYPAVLAAAARLGRRAYALAFATLVTLDKDAVALAPFLLYESLGPRLPEGTRSTAVLWGLAQRVARLHPQAVRRAGHTGPDALFDAMLAGRSGIVFTEDELADAWSYVRHPGHRIPARIPQLLDLLARLDQTPADHTTDQFPMVLSAGQRRSFTANTIFRTDAWRQRDVSGALRICPQDADRLGVADGSRARITTRRGSAVALVEVDDRLQPGHAALPNGFGLDLPGDSAGAHRVGVAPNDLTELSWRDPLSGTPWHKHVPARIEPLSPDRDR